MDLNVADGFLIALLAMSAIIGIYRGFVREVLTLITWVVAAYFSFLHGKEAGNMFAFVESESIREGFGIALIFFTILLLGSIIKFIICRAFSVAGPSIIDRIGGLAFGVARAFALVIAVFLIAPNSVKDQSWYADSKLIPSLHTAAKFAADATPQLWKKEAQAQLHASLEIS